MQAHIVKTPVKLSITAGVGALLLLIGLGGTFFYIYIAQERQRDLLQWESRLGLVADAKAAAVSRLLGDDLRDLGELADNASLRLYLWQAIRARETS